ncbi:MAG: redox-sensing transcriptional repressor Rex [Dehalococcoidia bacterium]
MHDSAVLKRASPGEVPEVVILRLPLYSRVLAQLLREGMEVVSSQQLGQRLQVTPAQIRKDLSYFGRFGKQGRGYSVRHLLLELKQILGLDREWNVGLVGVGRLGRAILGYPGFAPEGFKIVAAFDRDPRVVGQVYGAFTVQPMERLCPMTHALDIKIAIVAVPAERAQEVIEQLAECGIKAILNYAAIAPQHSPDVKVRSIDPVLSLQSMTYHLRAASREST